MNAARLTPADIRAWKGREPLPVLTAYDHPTARLLDDCGIPFLHVGDSLGMVVLGYPDTTHVTMDEMVHHVRAVARARPRALVAADLPYRSYDTPAAAVANARRLADAGADAVKAEGGREILPQIEAILAAGIPVCGHLGMLPQHVLEEGGYHIKGKDDATRQALLADADALAAAGVFAIVLELVKGDVAAEITRRIPVPTIGIGSGTRCDGQVLVSTDLFGTSPNHIPKHVRIRADCAAEMRRVVGEWVTSLSRPE